MRTTKRAPGSPKIAVAYARVSTDEQRLGPEAQRAAIDSWAAREGVQVAAWCVDHGVSGAAGIEARPALGAALGALREHGAGVLVVAKRDRIARDVVIAAGIERAATSAGARLMSADGTGNGDTPADAFMRTVIDGAAAYERGLIRARTKAALAAKAAKGERVSGGIPYGFALAEDGVHFGLVESERATIARACELAAGGDSLRRVAAKLATEGRISRNGRPFAAAQVARMLQRRAFEPATR
ncbi:MAG TPA: recombinase family protein [Polyangiaceae bacterium]|nr:recombinase family protein [Polyangiaceae bacterium]